jgi:hypothetical protein
MWVAAWPRALLLATWILGRQVLIPLKASMSVFISCVVLLRVDKGISGIATSESLVEGALPNA